jgi:hypothetical protein
LTRHARQLPEVRSRLLAFYDRHAPTLWAGLRLDTPASPVPPALSGTDPAGLPARVAAWEAAAIRAAELFWVAADMTEMIQHAAASMPRFPLRPEILPAPQGLLVWQAPILTRTRPRYGQVPTRGGGPVAGASGLTYLGLADNDGNPLPGWEQRAPYRAVPAG